MPSVWELAPERKLIADSYHDEPLECQGAGVMDSVGALHNGGVYFGFGGMYDVSPDGQVTKVFDKPINDAALSLGTIAAPRRLIDIAFSGSDKKTLFAVAEVAAPGMVEHDEVFTLQMVAQGYLGRGK